MFFGFAKSFRPAGRSAARGCKCKQRASLARPFLPPTLSNLLRSRFSRSTCSHLKKKIISSIPIFNRIFLNLIVERRGTTRLWRMGTKQRFPARIVARKDWPIDARVHSTASEKRVSRQKTLADRRGVTQRRRDSA